MAPEVVWLDQVHGTEVVVVAGSGSETGERSRPAGVVCAGVGDALVCTEPATAITVLTADCASVALGSAEGVFGAVHGGWRGLAGGVVEKAVATMRSQGAGHVFGAVGPCIHAECYEFAEHDLERVVARYGFGVAGRTAEGRPALDLPALVSAALRSTGVTEVAGPTACTSCSGRYFSHRARRDTGRQALLVWSVSSERT